MSRIADSWRYRLRPHADTLVNADGTLNTRPTHYEFTCACEKFGEARGDVTEREFTTILDDLGIDDDLGQELANYGDQQTITTYQKLLTHIAQ